jgi:ABC-type oligopeptide transport system substrate-binding subunit
MKKSIRVAAAAAALTLCLCGASLAASAAEPNTNGSYKPTMEQAYERISVSDFLQPDVTITKKTHAINNVYDSMGNLVPATLSTDGHFYIIPTTTGYLMLGTGK